ncbi:MAG TPA: cellulase family glycosylhydrolase [Solirubrobacterales bacterium]
MRNLSLSKALSLALVSLLVCLALPALAAAKPAYLGFQVHSLWYERSTAEMQRELDLVQQTGGNVVRVDVGWSSLETEGKGEYTGWYLEKLDRFVKEANARQLKVIATLVTTPCWASSAPESLKQGCKGAWWERNVQNYPPNNPSDFGDAARFLTARYGTELAALEIWNEPNTERFLVAPNRASAYATLVKAAYPAAKEGNPAVPVIVGALAAADRPFLDELYAQGIKGYFDGISVHPYNEWRDPYDLWQPQWKKYTFLPGTEWIHEGQIAAGDNTPLWITEFGWDTCTGNEWCVSEAQQADYMVKALQILNTFSYVRGATGYELRDESTDKSEFEGNWGLVHQDFSPKPVLAAVTKQLHGELKEEPTVTLIVSVSPGGTVVAKGKAPQARNVSLKLNGCQAKGTHLIKTGSHGHFHRRLGFLKTLKGCRVTAQLPQSTGAASRTIPTGGGVAVANAIAVSPSA